MAGGRGGAGARLSDVAELAGVSIKTVSNVVHHYPHVSPDLRARVQAAIDQLGYRPNLTARRLVTGKTGMIALAIPWIDQPYFAEMSRHVGEEAARRGYRVLFEQTANSIELERAVLRDREQGLVDGVIFHPVLIDTLEIARLRPDNPLVLLGESAQPLTTDHVMIDNVAAARDGVDLLLRRGRRRIAFFATIRDDITGSTQQRLVGYQEALVAHGLPLDPGLVLGSDGWAVEDAAAAMAAALRRGVRFDAVVCRDDLFAVAALKALAAEGVAVPGDVAVVGWDDTALARYASPALTTVSPDKAAIARTALDLLTERMDGYTGIGRHRIVGHSIVERASTPAEP
jgi:DNA-binding LacI/PurR family transcriptional regulator